MLSPVINEPGNGVKIISARLAELNFTGDLVRNGAFAQHATHAHDGVFNGAQRSATFNRALLER